jgi:hypothetical protein
MNRSLFRLGLYTVLTLALAAANAYAQGSTTSTISGRVVDSSGGVLPGANVTARHLATTRESSTITNSEGAFTFPSMALGTYEISVALEGFKTTVVKDVVITAAQGADIQAKLEVGGVSETVTVASSSEIIQTQSTTISSTINTNQITKLPLTSRSAMDFVNFLPGVSTPGGNRQATINGLPQGVINITLDGINIQDNTLRSTDGFFSIVSPRLDAIEEVSVTTAGQGADAGQGAVQIKFVTRSGTNNYTGSGYHYFRSDKLNANTWFNNRDNTAKPKLKQNQTGVRFGGPLVIPGLLNRGKAFFFGNYEELSQPSDTTRTRTLLSAAAQNGNYTYNGVTVNVLALAAANANTAATSSPDPTIAALLGDIRAAANTGSVSSRDANLDELRYNVPVQSKRRFPTVRIDYNLTDNHRFTSSWNYNWFTDAPDTLNNFESQWPGFPAFGGQTSIRQSWSNSVRSTLGANLVNEARVGFSSSPVKFFDEMTVDMYNGSLANQKGFHFNFPSIGTQLTAASPSPTPQSRNVRDLAIEDTLTWLRGNHNFTFGASWTSFDGWFKNSNLVPRLTFGVLTTDPANQVFSAAALQAATGVAPSNAQLTQARDLYAFLTGRLSGMTGDARLNEGTGQYEFMGVGTQRAQMRETGLFVQDSWRLRPNLTLNAGLRYSLQFPFTASNNSYTAPTIEDLCGRSGVDSTGNGCNLFQPGVMPGKANPQFFQLTKGTSAYNTDYNNFAPNVGIAWTPAQRGGLLGALMSEEFVVRAGWSRAFSRNGMNDFTGQYNSNPGVVISANRNEGLGNIIPSGAAAPVLLRNDANLGAASFNPTPVYPLTDVVTGDIRMFAPDIEIPYADSWSVGFQRKVSTNMAAEIRYVGTLSRDLWAARNFNEVNIVENGFLDEFRAAQANLVANMAAGNGNTFAYTGAPGTSPLPILLAHFNAQPTANAGNTALYTGTNWTNSAFLALLSARNPNPYGFANTSTTGNASATALIGNATFRNNAIAAGLPRNLFIANPDLVGGAILTRNEGFTDYHSLQLELRRRLAQGFQFQTSYVFGKAMQSDFQSFRTGLATVRDVGSPGDITHQFKANIVYDLPFGQGRRFMSGAGGLMERLVGGWQIGLNTRIQSGQLVNLGNIRLVGWSRSEVADAFKLRFDDDGKVIFNFPEEVITNTIRAFSVSPTSATGYSGAAPEGRYFAPANGPDCIEVVQGSGECGGTRQLILSGPLFQQSDLRVAKRTQIVGRVNFEFAAEMLNVFNHPNFVPNGQSTSTTLNNWRVTGLTGTNTSRVIQLVSRINW